MKKHTLILLILALFCLPVLATAQGKTSGLRVSLLTCGPGYDEVYQVFGHTAVRVIDSNGHTDLVYNYGTFDGFQKNFELKFMRGLVMYYLTVDPFNSFMGEYVQEKRSVTEQVLQLTEQQKESIVSYLDWNAEPENREYKYDFFYDNCSTRIRDIFSQKLDKNFVFGKTLPPVPHYTFRDIINQYFYTVLWERFGINILLGSRIDKVMTSSDIMFLPDYLLKGMQGANINGKEVAAPPVTILAGGPPMPAPINGPLILTCLIAVLTIAGLTFPKLKLLGKIMSASLLVITGLLGCLILVMWFGTSHGGCRDNFNLLWALPTNLIIAFAKPKGRSRYALVALFFIVISLLLHIFRVQQMLLLEFFPLLVALAYIYGSIYRSSKIKTPVADA